MQITLNAVEMKALGRRAAKTSGGGQPVDEEAVVRAMLASVVADELHIPSAQFVLRFTPAEIGAIVAARQQSPQLDAYMDELTSAPLVYTGSALVRGGMAALVSAGLITQARADEILDI